MSNLVCELLTGQQRASIQALKWGGGGGVTILGVFFFHLQEPELTRHKYTIRAVNMVLFF